MLKWTKQYGTLGHFPKKVQNGDAMKPVPTNVSSVESNSEQVPVQPALSDVGSVLVNGLLQDVGRVVANNGQIQVQSETCNISTNGRVVCVVPKNEHSRNLSIPTYLQDVERVTTVVTVVVNLENKKPIQQKSAASMVTDRKKVEQRKSKKVRKSSVHRFKKTGQTSGAKYVATTDKENLHTTNGPLANVESASIVPKIETNSVKDQQFQNAASGSVHVKVRSATECAGGQKLTFKKRLQGFFRDSSEKTISKVVSKQVRKFSLRRLKVSGSSIKKIVSESLSVDAQTDDLTGSVETNQSVENLATKSRGIKRGANEECAGTRKKMTMKKRFKRLLCCLDDSSEDETSETVPKMIRTSSEIDTPVASDASTDEEPFDDEFLAMVLDGQSSVARHSSDDEMDNVVASDASTDEEPLDDDFLAEMMDLEDEDVVTDSLAEVSDSAVSLKKDSVWVSVEIPLPPKRTAESYLAEGVRPPMIVKRFTVPWHAPPVFGTNVVVRPLVDARPELTLFKNAPRIVSFRSSKRPEAGLGVHVNMLPNEVELFHDHIFVQKSRQLKEAAAATKPEFVVPHHHV